jgi:hypothetical protein
MKNLIVLMFVLALLALPGVVRADEDEPMIEGVLLPDWVSSLAFGTLGLSLIVSAATEVTKRALQLARIYKDGWGRWIVGVWTFGFVGLALASNLLDAGAIVDARVEWLYQLMLLMLTLLGAPTAYSWAKATGLVKSVPDDSGDMLE